MPRPLRGVRRRLARRHVPQAIALARRWSDYAHLSDTDRDDVLGAAFLGLTRAAVNYRTRQLAWPAYAAIMIEGEIRRELRRMGRWRSVRAWTLVEHGPDRLDPGAPHAPFADVDVRDEADRAIMARLGLLSPREREAITLYLGGLRWFEVARAMGVGPQRVERCRINAVAKLRAAAGAQSAAD